MISILYYLWQKVFLYFEGREPYGFMDKLQHHEVVMFYMGLGVIFVALDASTFRVIALHDDKDK